MTASDSINICLATDRNYLQHAGAVIASVLKHALPEDKLGFYILQENLNPYDREKLISLGSIKPCSFKFIVPKLAELPEMREHKYISRAALFRLQLAELLPEVDRIIYLDCDLMVVSSLRELWETDLGNAIIAGCGEYDNELETHKELIGCREKSYYVNSGVLLIDLAKSRRENMTAEYMQVSAEIMPAAKYLDQDVINVACQGRILPLPLKWNLSSGYFRRRYELQYYTDAEIIEAVKNPAIVHISGKRKCWLWRRCRHPYWFEYFKALKDTPWKHKYWRGIIKKIFFPCRRIHGPAADWDKEDANRIFD